MQGSDVKLSLQWNEFHENLRSVFGNLRCDSDFTDVTLASEDGRQIDSHKIVLVASSPFFMDLLKKNKHSHPFIFFRGVSFENLSAVVDFLYQGETNVFQENLNSFLNLAEDMKLRGLEGTRERVEVLLEKNYAPQNKEDYDQAFISGQKLEESKGNRVLSKGKTTNKDLASFLTLSEELKLKEFNMNQTEGKAQMDQKSNFPNDSEQFDNLDSKVKSENSKETSIPLKGNTTTKDLEELDLEVKSMMEVSENAAPGKFRGRGRICKVCGKEGVSAAIIQHIESHHAARLSIPCRLCGNIFSTRQSLMIHKSKYHRKGKLAVIE